jgi:hypothetical protein
MVKDVQDVKKIGYMPQESTLTIRSKKVVTREEPNESPRVYNNTSIDNLLDFLSRIGRTRSL